MTGSGRATPAGPGAAYPFAPRRTSVPPTGPTPWPYDARLDEALLSPAGTAAILALGLLFSLTAWAAAGRICVWLLSS